MPSEYSDLVNLFIDLRGHGVSLSTIDLDILQHWQQNNLAVDLIATIMLELKSECQLKNKHFPNTLAPIARKLNKVLLKMRES